MQFKNSRPLFYKTCAFFVLCGLFAFLVSKHIRNHLVEQKLDIDSKPIVFNPAKPSQVKFGKLRWVGGLELNADSHEFGGISGLNMTDTYGKRFLMITDDGFWITGRIAYDKGLPTGIEKARIGPLLKKGKRLSIKNHDYPDAEATSVNKKKLLVSFEKDHRISEFAFSHHMPGPWIKDLTIPEEIQKLERNAGLEAMTSIKAGPYKGYTLAFAETFEKPKGFIRGWLIHGDTYKTIQLERINNFCITDAEALPDGGVLILERFYNLIDGFKMRIRYLSPEEIVPDKPIKGEILLSASNHYTIDNMEGITYHENEEGQRIITVMSDDNFSPIQRTLLLQFEWPKAKSPQALQPSH